MAKNRVQIGTVGQGIRIHLIIDGKGCGAGRGARISHETTSGLRCARCFTVRRIALASQVNAMSNSNWNHSTEMFLMDIAAPAAVERTSDERLAQMVTELNAQFAEWGM